MQDKRNQQFSIEPLEDRLPMDASSVLSGGVITIRADADGGEVDASQSGNRIAIVSYEGPNLRTDTFDAAKISRIVFQGSDAADDFSNRTQIQSEIFGKGGNDVISGGSGRDIIFAGSGNDRVYANGGGDYVFGEQGVDTIEGGSGNDYVFGGADRDTIYGQNGNDRIVGEGGDDALYGGSGADVVYGGYSNELAQEVAKIGSELGKRLWGSLMLGMNTGQKDGRDYLDGGSNDDWLFGGTERNEVHGGTGQDALLSLRADDEQLYGGSGADRFLIHKNTSVDTPDYRSNDAKIRFVDSNDPGSGYSAAKWTVKDIRRVDRVFADVQRITGTTALLKGNEGGTVSFVRRGVPVVPNVDGVAFNSTNGSIVLTNHVFANGDNWLTQVVTHELGHNWEAENRDWKGFKALSGWIHSTTNSSQYVNAIDEDSDWSYLTVKRNDFVSDYAKTNPLEDFAESFAAYFMDRLGRPFAGAGADAAPDKMAFINTFVTSLA